jgi:hypothetical protein
LNRSQNQAANDLVAIIRFHRRVRPAGIHNGSTRRTVGDRSINGEFSEFRPGAGNQNAARHS